MRSLCLDAERPSRALSLSSSFFCNNPTLNRIGLKPQKYKIQTQTTQWRGLKSLFSTHKLHSVLPRFSQTLLGRIDF